jgi:protease-4
MRPAGRDVPPGEVPPRPGNAGAHRAYQPGAAYAPGGYGPGYAPGGYAPGGYGPGYAPGMYRPAPKKKMRTWKKALIIVAVSLAALAALFLFSRFVTGMFTAETGELSLPTEEYLARISVVGEIGDFNDPYTSSADAYHHGWTMETLDRLMEDDNNRGLLLYVDSPGGSVYESDELYLKIMEYKAVTERPVYVYMGSMAASGGYYISAPADRIYANRNTWTGSIGVIIGTLFDVSGFLEKHGVKATEITSGANKGMGSYFEPMTEEQRALFQGLVDEAYEQFVGIVADGRGMSVDAVRQIADGRVLTARQALEASLIDEIALETDALEAIKADLGDMDINVANLDFSGQFSLFGAPLIRMFPSEFGDLFSGTNGTDSQASANEAVSDALSGDVIRVLELARQGGRVPIKYMYQG